MSKIDPRDRMIVALDLPSVTDAQAMIGKLGGSVTFYKIGMELVYAGGLDLVRQLSSNGKKVFLDLKLHDIPNTVEKATQRVADLGATFLTVHAFPQTMKAALKGKGSSSLQILGVTVMTSYDDSDLIEAGYAMGVRDLVAHRAQQAKIIGIDGLILSPEEVGSMRTLVGSSLTLITPGIRPKGSEKGDQKRVMTPGEAISAGADYLVIGRPITSAGDPEAVANVVVDEISSVLG
jgi:orotidine-5'-phosphate decarboxylase